MAQSKFGIAVLCVALLAYATPSMGLSWELCDNYGSEWVTGSPHLEGKFPFYSLIFSCLGKAPQSFATVSGLSWPHASLCIRCTGTTCI